MLHTFFTAFQNHHLKQINLIINNKRVKDKYMNKQIQ